jgi:hypothetical protein
MPKQSTVTQKDYGLLQQSRGHAQVRVWLPAYMTDWLHQIAEEARKMHECGLDPMERVPASLLPTRATE